MDSCVIIANKAFNKLKNSSIDTDDEEQLRREISDIKTEDIDER